MTVINRELEHLLIEVEIINKKLIISKRIVYNIFLFIEH